MAVPLGFYLVTKLYANRNIRFPAYYGTVGVDSVSRGGVMHYDTNYHQVGDFHLTNQLGQPCSFDSIGPKVVLVDFFFTSCPSFCPTLSRNLKWVQTSFAASDTGLRILSFTVDPKHDSVARLRAYADHYGADPDVWWLLTGDKKQIYDMARKQFFVDAEQGDGGPEDFVHTDKWVLLDRHRFIRGYYSGVDSAEVKRCMHDIAMLMIEKDLKH